MTKILEFKGEHEYLSNFYLCSFTWDGIKWPHSEAAYQAAKSPHAIIRKKFVNLSPGKAKRYGKTIIMRDDWEDVKLEVMAEIIFHKFEQNPDIKEKLLATTGELQEGNWWGDKFWGVSPAHSNNGQNHLGRILMEYRDLCLGTAISGLVTFY